MATSAQNNPLPRPHKQRGRLLLFVILALFGIGLFSIGHAFHKISKLSKQVSHLSDLLRQSQTNRYSYLNTQDVVTELAKNQASTKREVASLSSLLSQYRNDLLLVSESLSKSGKHGSDKTITKTLQDINTAIATQTQEIANIKNQLETSEKVIQAVVTSQVADIKRHEDLWNAIRKLEGSFGTLADDNKVKSMSETYDRRIEQLSQEVNVQKTKIEELNNARKEQPQEAENKDKKVSNEAKKKQDDKTNSKENNQVNKKVQENAQGGFHDTVKEAFKKGNSMFKNVDEATKKMMKKIERRASGVSKNIEKVKKAIVSLFG